MNKIAKNIFTIALVITGGLLYTACSDMMKEYEEKLVVYPEITLNGFTPQSGRPGEQVTITGTDFGEYADAATVRFNGVEVTDFESYADDRIVVRVPADAGSGKIIVQVWTHVKEFENEFTFIPGAKISSISPEEAPAGTQLTITGENFGSDAAAVTVWFGGDVEAEIVSISDNQIVVTVPDGGIRGAIILELGPQTLTGPIFSYPFVGLNFEFNTDGDSEGWLTSHNSAADISGGTINVSYDMTATKRRADFSLQGGAEVHAGLYPIVAIRMINKPTSGNFIFDTNLGRYKDGSNNWDGILVGDVYYYDLRNTFGSGATLSTTEPTQLTTFQWKVADITTAETGYQVDWVKSFESLDALKEFVTPPPGKYIFEFNDRARQVTPDVYDDWMARSDQSGWAGPTTTFIEGGYSKVTFASPSDGVNKNRADYVYSFGGDWGSAGSGIDKEPWVYSKEFPIYAIKVHFVQNDGSLGGPRPARGSIFYDRLGQFNDDYVAKNVLWVDASTWGGDGIKEEGSWWQIKVADILSDEQGFWIDWHRTFRSVEELEAFIGQ